MNLGEKMKRFAVFLTFTALCALIFLVGSVQSQSAQNKLHKKEKKIANQYIVVLEDWAVSQKGEYSLAPDIAENMGSLYGGKLKHIYKHAVSGFSIEMTEAEATRLSEDYRVKFVEEDGPVQATTVQTGAP